MDEIERKTVILIKKYQHNKLLSPQIFHCQADGLSVIKIKFPENSITIIRVNKHW